MKFFSKVKNFFNSKNNSHRIKKNAKLVITEEIRISNDINPILLKNNYSGLNAGEIVLLNWIDNKFINVDYPVYFVFQYGLNVQDSIKKLKSHNLIDYGDYEAQLNALRVKELKNILHTNNIVPKGNKQSLIKSILSENITVSDLPDVWTATKEGLNVMTEYEHIILSHKEKYIDVANIIVFKNKLKEKMSYDDLIWKYLTEQAIQFSNNKEFGSLRFVYFQQAEKTYKSGNYLTALSLYIAVVLFDASGLDNSLNYKTAIMVTVNDYILDRTETIIKENNLSKSEYYKIFERGLRFFKPYQNYSFLNNADLEIIKDSIYDSNIENISKQLNQYME